MFNNKPIINASPTGFATDIGNNHLGSFDTQGNFKTLLDPYPTAKVDAFGYLRDNVTNNVIGEVRGVLPRNDLYTHKPYNYNNSLELPGLNSSKSYDYKDSFELPGLNSSKSYDYKDIFELPAYKPNNLYDI